MATAYMDTYNSLPERKYSSEGLVREPSYGHELYYEIIESFKRDANMQVTQEDH